VRLHGLNELLTPGFVPVVILDVDVDAGKRINIPLPKRGIKKNLRILRHDRLPSKGLKCFLETAKK